MRRALIVIAKRPAPGRTKTRLCPPLTGTRASELYECFLKDSLDTARKVDGVERLVAFAPRDQARYFRDLAPDFGLLPQVGRSLGDRLDNALTHCLNNGFRRAVIIGSDCPALPPDHIDRAFGLLEKTDVVLGPCNDGGYYLIGLNRPHPSLLLDVRMSTPEVLRDTLALADQEKLSVALAPSCYDVDTIDDLRRLEAELPAATGDVGYHTLRFLRQTSATE
jgi:uncharacterized protein